MTTATLTDAPVRRASVPWWARRRLILLVTLGVIPFGLSALLNSYGPLTVDTALRMAFATVAGQTVAILGALAAIVVTIAYRRPWAGVIFFGLVLLLVVASALTAMEDAGALLLERLALIAEVDRLN